MSWRTSLAVFKHSGLEARWHCAAQEACCLFSGLYTVYWLLYIFVWTSLTAERRSVNGNESAPGNPKVGAKVKVYPDDLTKPLS